MSDMLGDALAGLHADLNAYCSVPAVYARGTDTVSLNVVPGKRLLQLQDSDGGLQMEWTDLDVLILGSELILDSVLTLPQVGDTVTLAVGRGSQTFEVLSYGGTESLFVWCDPGQTMLRVHTKSVTTPL